MSVKLLLNPAADARACVHPDTGITFMVRPITPEQYEAIRRASLTKDKGLDIVKWGTNFAVAAIEGWGDGVGDSNGALECNEANLRTFGRNQALNIMPWIIDQACSLDQYRIEEEAAAKNG
jgi:hypothetical protein